mgnify:CR=1 FL=1
MRFYVNVSYDIRKNLFHIREYDNGKRIVRSERCRPYAFVTNSNQTYKSDYKTLDGKSVAKVSFDSRNDYIEFIENHTNVENFKFYGLGVRPFELIHNFINDEYPGTIDYNFNALSVVVLDIETDSEDGFPNLETANKQVTAITIRKNNKRVVLGLQQYKNQQEDTQYFQCKNEEDLLNKFLILWKSSQFSPDIVTGWNIEQFDIPYLFKRIERIFDYDKATELSPFKLIDKRKFKTTYGETVVYHPAGIAILDYLNLYKKFSYTPQESYKLDHIAFMELGEKKLDFRALGFETLDEFYKKDFQNFINYNIKDVDLVYDLEQKLKLIEQVCALAYDGKVNLIEAQTTVRMWDVIIHNHLRNKKIVVPFFEPYGDQQSTIEDSGIQGAYVKDPLVGLHKWVVSFDLNSLYPHLIMQYNISPETYVGRDLNVNIDKLIEGQLRDEDLQNKLRNNDVTFCGSGCMFNRSHQGFLPELMEKMYNDRVVWKERMIEAKKKFEKTPTVELRNEIARCHNMQLAKKIQLNSAYGALGNKFFRWFDRKYAESITLSGQLSIRWMEKHINQWLNDKIGSNNVDYVIACDTDSMYINLEKYVEKFHNDVANENMIDILDNDCREIFELFIDETYNQLGVLVNAYQQKMKMKREAIADKGIWTGKKHYILNVFDNEGVRFKQPKLKMQGIEAIRSSTPSACRESIKKALEVIMGEDEQSVIQYIEEFKKKFEALPFEQIAFPRSVQNINKWINHGEIKSACPIHVRGTILYNMFVKKYNLEAKYNLINDGDKIKFSYMKMPNPLQNNVFATPGFLPAELELESYIDYEKQFEKSFLEPIKTILTAIGWRTEKHYTVEDFFQ